MANEMRDRLVELIKQARQRTKNANCDIERKMLFADHLIENGVVVPPCKVGDTVYFPNEGYHDSAEIERIYIDENGVSFAWVQYDYGPDIVEVWDDGEFSIDEIGKTVFLTMEAKAEAEQKLKEMRGV